jgi:hypothetical protein
MHYVPPPDPAPAAVHAGWYQVNPSVPYWYGPYRIKGRPGLWSCLVTGKRGPKVCVPYRQ